MIRYRFAAFLALLLASCAVIGCTSDPSTAQAFLPKTQPKSDDVAVERAKLPTADQALVDAQEWCVVNTKERLGSMGPPLKFDIKGQPVFVCCKGCQKKAESDPDKTLAKVDELKAQAKADKKNQK